MKYYLAIIGAAAAGVLIAFEPTINGRLGKIASPSAATIHSSLSGTIIILLITMMTGGLSEYKQVFKAPPYLLIGGLVGLGIVYLGGKVSPVLGIATTVSVMVAVQMIVSMIVDNFGLFGVEQVPVNMYKIIGALLLLTGVQFIIRS